MVSPSGPGHSPNKWKIVDAAQRVVDQIERGYDQGAITETERYNQLIDVWIRRERVGIEMMDTRLRYAREIISQPHLHDGGSGMWFERQIRQLAGMRGLMAKPPAKFSKPSDFEGLSVLEYFTTTRCP